VPYQDGVTHIEGIQCVTHRFGLCAGAVTLGVPRRLGPSVADKVDGERAVAGLQRGPRAPTGPGALATRHGSDVATTRSAGPRSDALDRARPVQPRDRSRSLVGRARWTAVRRGWSGSPATWARRAPTDPAVQIARSRLFGEQVC